MNLTSYPSVKECVSWRNAKEVGPKNQEGHTSPIETNMRIR